MILCEPINLSVKKIQTIQMEMNRGKLTVLLRQANLHATQKEEQLEPSRTHGCRLKLKTVLGCGRGASLRLARRCTLQIVYFLTCVMSPSQVTAWSFPIDCIQNRVHPSDRDTRKEVLTALQKIAAEFRSRI